MIRSLSHVRLAPRGRRSLFARIAAAFAIRRQRNDLSRLPPHMLRDIGLTEEEAQAEASRALWDVPSHWRG